MVDECVNNNYSLPCGKQPALFIQESSRLWYQREVFVSNMWWFYYMNASKGLDQSAENDQPHGAPLQVPLMVHQFCTK